MFSRRHPYLFSFLVFSTLVTVSVVSILVVLATTMKRAGLSELIVEPGDGKVGIVEIEGVITESRDVLSLIKRFRKNDDIKAIVIRIDSPGGVIGPSQEIYREIRKTTQNKKIIASMGSIAASGGYYIASATNGIVANPGAITGSIGVIMAYTNFRKVLDKIGMVPVVIKSGPFKDMASPTKDMSKEEKEVLQTFVDQAHRQFVTAIAEGRNMDIDHVKALADGRIYTGEEAVKQGLEQAIEQDISLRNAHRAMSYIAAEDKDWEAAIRHYNQVLQYRTFENSTYDYFRLGSLYLKSEEQEKVEANFIKGLDRSRSRDKDLEWIYGQYRKENKLEGFTQFFLQVSNHFISTAAMEILHARAFIDLKEYDQAKEVLLTVNKRSPEAVAYYWLSHIAELEKEWDIMDLAIQKATVLDPENSEYHYKFSRVLNRLKKYERAEKEASLAIKYRSKNPTSGFFNYRAGIRWTMKDYEGAAKDWKSAISLKPDHAAFYAQAGEAYAKLAYWPMAEEHYQKAMELAPNNKRYRDRYNAVKGSGSSEQ